MTRYRELGLTVVLCSLALATTGCDQVQGLKDRFLGVGDEIDHLSAQVAAIESALDAGDVGNALSMAQQLTAENPNAADAHYWAGRAHLSRVPETVEADADPTGDEIASVDAFEKALSLNPRHARAAVGLGDLFSRRVAASNRQPGAEDLESPYALSKAAYEKAVNIDPKLPEGQHKLAKFLERTGSAEDAEVAYLAAIEAAATIPEIAPDHYMAYGHFLAARDTRLDEAMDQFELAAMFRQDDPVILEGMGKLQWRVAEAHLKKNEFMLAEEALSRARDLFPDPNTEEAKKTAEALARLDSMRGRRRR